MKTIDEVRQMIVEVNNPRNDGYVVAGIKKELQEIYNLIQRKVPELKDADIEYYKKHTGQVQDGDFPM